MGLDCIFKREAVKKDVTRELQKCKQPFLILAWVLKINSLLCKTVIFQEL